MEEGTMYRGEIKVCIGGNEARINVFSDNLTELFKDLGMVHAQFGKADTITNPAKRAIVNAEEIARRQREQAAASAPAREITGRAGEIPVCPNCGTGEFMELIEFSNKKTGQLKKAWKCHQCEKWYWPNGKGEGR